MSLKLWCLRETDSELQALERELLPPPGSTAVIHISPRSVAPLRAQFGSE